MESISVFDMLKIGVGPSSSHTLGPWRAAQRWINSLKATSNLHYINSIKIQFYGSLSLTGKGHATDIAVLLGLAGYDPETINTKVIDNIIFKIKSEQKIELNGELKINFDFNTDMVFEHEFLPFHPNALTFTGFHNSAEITKETYYSIGGGFVVIEAMPIAELKQEVFNTFPFPITTGKELLSYCKKENRKISEIVMANEKTIRTEEQINAGLEKIWTTMLESIYTGCHTEGILPGGLNVRRRAFDLYHKLREEGTYDNQWMWLEKLRTLNCGFRQTLKWVSCFALAVNEVNASLGRVVTAPTNGSAGVIPSVMMYYLMTENKNAGFQEIKNFLLVASEIGSIFKKGATISAAMGGCQAEIGVSSAMAAGALTELLGGSPEQVLIAAEIAMEHHLGLTCDPINGLVQIPCIERNSMGAIKAINAAELALDCDPEKVKIPFDNVVNTMWETAKDMNSKYKETSTGGLAVQVFLSDC